MGIGATMPIDCDCGDKGCKGHGRNLHIKDRLWFLFWGSVAVGFMQLIVHMSDRYPTTFDNYLIGFVIGCVVMGVFLLRFDDDN